MLGDRCRGPTSKVQIDRKGMMMVIMVVLVVGGGGGARHKSLQVAVHFETMVPRVSYHNMAIRGEGQALGAIKRVRRCVDVGEEGATAIKHLHQRNHRV